MCIRDREYTGELTETETTPLTTAVLKGLLTPILQQTVNFVNARNIAEERLDQSLLGLVCPCERLLAILSLQRSI